MLTLLATLFAILLGLPIGIVSATRAGSWADLGAMLVAMGGISMPSFWVGLNLIFVFAVMLGVFPVAGYQPLSRGLWENLRYLALPAVTLGFAQAALLARMSRSMMLEVLREDYVRTARAKGLAERTVVLVHALKNAMVPLVTVMGLTFAILMGGAVITEQVFNIPGLGRLLVAVGAAARLSGGARDRPRDRLQLRRDQPAGGHPVWLLRSPGTPLVIGGNGAIGRLGDLATWGRGDTLELPNRRVTHVPARSNAAVTDRLSTRGHKFDDVYVGRISPGPPGPTRDAAPAGEPVPGTEVRF